MKYDDLFAGMMVKLDDGFPCRKPGFAKVRWDEVSKEYYFECEFGHHYLGSQMNENGELIGVIDDTEKFSAKRLFNSLLRAYLRLKKVF